MRQSGSFGARGTGKDGRVGIALGLGALAVVSGLHLWVVVVFGSRRLGPTSMVGLRFGARGPEDLLPWVVVRPVFAVAGLAVPVVCGARLAVASSDGPWEIAGAVVMTGAVTLIESMLIRAGAEEDAEPSPHD